MVCMASVAMCLSLAYAEAVPTTTPAAGGAFQRSSVEGCANEYLFNGVWRIKVLSLDAPPGGPIRVTLQVRNGSHADYPGVMYTGFGGINGALIDLVFDDQNTENMTNADQFVPYNNSIAFKHVPVGGAVTGTLMFSAPQNAASKPVKLLIGYDPKANQQHAHYTVRDPSFRVHLDCGS
jgi:hypothetical protein